MRLYGKNPVLERLKFAPKTIHKIFIQEGHPDLGYLNQKAKQWSIPVVAVPASKIQKLARNSNTQGMLADVEDFSYVPLADLLSAEGKKRRILVFMDELTDPQNLGGILRTLACLGNFAVVLPSHRSVDITESVLRVACGGENYVPVAKVSNLTSALAATKEAGFWIAGTVVKDGENICETKLPFPLALVIGSEQKGIRDVVAKQLDVTITIPMAQPRMVMNAAHATSILAYEVVRQWTAEKKNSD